MRARIFAFALLCSCSFSEEKVRVKVAVTNIPPDAGQLVVTVTDSASASKIYKPLTVAADGGVLSLAFPPPAQNGRVDVRVQVPDQVVETTASDLYVDPNELDLTARIGFATRCGGGCAPTLSCVVYAAENGVCTHSCSSAAQCESTLPKASCDGGCQWDCSDGGVCPPGLTCVTSGPAKFCSGL